MRIDNESVEILSSSNIWSSYVSFLIFPKLLYCIDYESLATLKSFFPPSVISFTRLELPKGGISLSLHCIRSFKLMGSFI